MGKGTRSRKGVSVHVPARGGNDERRRPETPADVPQGDARPSRGGNAESSREAGDSGGVRETDSITELDDGTICLGQGCSVLRIRPSGNLELDATKCPERIAARLEERLRDGAATAYTLNPARKKKGEGDEQKG